MQWREREGAYLRQAPILPQGTRPLEDVPGSCVMSRTAAQSKTHTQVWLSQAWALLHLLAAPTSTEERRRGVAQSSVFRRTGRCAGDLRDLSWILGSGRSPGGGRGNPLQYPCLENPMDGGAWRAAVHGVTKSWTQLKRLSTHDAEPVRDENQSEGLGAADPSKTASCALLSSHLQGSNSLFFLRSSKQQNPEQNPR